MPIRKLLACALLVTLASCEDVFSPRPNTSAVSSVTFGHAAFGGRPAGTYSAMGEVPMENGGFPLGDWAFAYPTGPAPQPLVVEASRTAANGRFDVVTMLLPRGVQAGQTVRFGQMCETLSCAQMSVDFGFHPHVDAPEIACAMRSGELRLTTLSDRRVAGTFSGTAACSGTQSGETQIQRGAFDVALIVPT
ncbi:MAG TPA: hypothetical protein VF006_18110 [Longimicrobium sp.]